ncbi:intradiol ring-cleavage dioxygenase [Cellvibrio japonicus]|uniref:Protocatechuate dioxygenase n=1 Tax=Cellvibrio japonicus (strain Ueda107) TaxID=498211 RepID=B3PC34_CELJU|nr:intradiol ring-cleavage dioxygenase [Cellvibrio japonicus]ACE86099.1 protocatechuate dioxygenase [Cellvibrio japonicus Ueda107]
MNSLDNNSASRDLQPTTTSTPSYNLHDPHRRKALGALGLFGLAGAAGLISCGGGSSGSNSTGTSSATTSSSTTSSSATTSSIATSSSSSGSGSCVVIPTETIGPYPLSTLLDNSLILRENIAEDKTGVPLQVKLKLVNVNNSCTPVSAYVYIWHCDKDGNYSGYTTEVGKTYCRGIQYTDTDGVASFTTVYPGWYAGRITHIHFQIFLTNYGSNAQSSKISQMAFPQDITRAVYNSTLYTKGQNTSVTSFATDNVFSDGVEYQLATVTGSVSDGYVAELEVGLAL